MKTTRCILLWLLVLAIIGPRLASADDSADTCIQGDEESSAATVDAAKEDADDFYTILGKPSEYTPSMTSDVQLAVRRWIPPSQDDIKSVVLFVHGGAGWHTGYSEIMGQSLRAAGIAVVAYDSMGSGYSTGVG